MRKRSNIQLGNAVEDPGVEAFLDDIVAVCEKHGMSLGHEDGHGNFIVCRDQKIYASNLQWLESAAVDRPEGK